MNTRGKHRAGRLNGLCCAFIAAWAASTVISSACANTVGADDAAEPPPPATEAASWSLTDEQKDRLRSFIRSEAKVFNAALLARDGLADTPAQREACVAQNRDLTAALARMMEANKLAANRRGDVDDLDENFRRDWVFLPLGSHPLTRYDLPSIDAYLAELDATGIWKALDAAFASEPGGILPTLIDEQQLDAAPKPEEFIMKPGRPLTPIRRASSAAVGSLRLAVTRAGKAGSADAVQRWTPRAVALADIAQSGGSVIGDLVVDAVLGMLHDELTFLQADDLLSEQASLMALDLISRPRRKSAVDEWTPLHASRLAMEEAAKRVRQTSAGFRSRLGALTSIVELAGRNDQPLSPDERELENKIFARLPDWPELRQDPEAMLGAVRVFSSGSLRARAARTRLAGVQVLMAINAFRERTGDWPKTLDDLVPHTLKAIPADAVTGQPWRYRVLPMPDEHGRAFLLYSIGLDLRDDRGKEFPHHSPTPLESPTMGEGYDYVVNQPRPAR